jgi:hypothetical protein
MSTSRRRLAIVSGTIVALAVAGTAIASAHGPRNEEGWAFGPGFGRGGPMRERIAEGVAGLGARLDGLVRLEATLQTDAGIVVERREHGTATAASAESLDYTLATDEPVSVAVDGDTRIVAYTQDDASSGWDRPFRRFRVTAEAIDPADIPVGSDVVVWSRQQDDGSFLAQRIVVLAPADDQDADTDATGESPAPAASVSPASPAPDA